MWAFWGLSALVLVVWAIRVRAWGVLAMQASYFTINMIGLFNALRVGS
jgi:hypothetical protein